MRALYSLLVQDYFFQNSLKITALSFKKASHIIALEVHGALKRSIYRLTL